LFTHKRVDDNSRNGPGEEKAIASTNDQIAVISTFEVQGFWDGVISVSQITSAYDLNL
jgi:hypothetical protein